jgi:hypothetical protein
MPTAEVPQTPWAVTTLLRQLAELERLLRFCLRSVQILTIPVIKSLRLVAVEHLDLRTLNSAATFPAEQVLTAVYQADTLNFGVAQAQTGQAVVVVDQESAVMVQVLPAMELQGLRAPVAVVVVQLRVRVGTVDLELLQLSISSRKLR